MKFKPGDQVSFVNEKGGGTVISITKNGSYKVALEDGFDLTLPEKELALVSRPADINPVRVNQVHADEQHEKPGLPSFNPPADTITFYIAPSHDNKILTGELTFFICNTTGWQVYFTLCYVKERKHYYLSSGKLSLGDQKEAGRFMRPEMTDWEHFHIQLLLFTEGSFDPMHPIRKDIPVLLPDLNNAGKEKGRLAFARSFEIYKVATEELPDINELKDKLFSPSKTSVTKNSPSKKKKDEWQNDDRFGILRNTKEVDLHIDVLVKSHGSLDQSAMLGVQLSHFRKEMDAAILNHFHSITFIHGVGEGILRNALIDELNSYKGITYRNGAYEKYGAGAIEVLLI